MIEAQAIVNLAPEVPFIIEGSDGDEKITWLDDQPHPAIEDIEAESERVITQNIANLYQRERRREYPSIGDQLDMIFHEIKANGSISADGVWATAIQEVKDLVPKPDDSTQPV